MCSSDLHLTADPALTQDMDHVFNHLASQSRLPRLKKLWLAPIDLQRKLIRQIDALATAAEAGKPARLVAKMNALTDEAIIRALIKAGQSGVKIDLVVRGACMLPPGLPNATANIKVRSVIGRFLEHSRVFYFRCAEEETLYLSSADWMNRNMLRRVELAWPVTDAQQRQRIVDECLVAYLNDGVDAWDLQADGSYTKVSDAKPGVAKDGAGPKRKGPRRPALGAQAALMDRYSGGNPDPARR